MNGKIKAPNIFRRKRFAQVSVGECVITAEQQKAIEVKEAIKQVLDEAEAEGIEIDAHELEQRIADICKVYGIDPPKPRHKNKLHTCPQCGAPIKDGKCDYCGTEYK